MKIGLFEYVRGGGFIDHPIGAIPSSLLREGRAMLEALLLNIGATGSFVPVVPLDGRIDDGLSLHPHAHTVLPGTDWLATWIALGCQCDGVLVIAPEIDGVLQSLVERLRSHGISVFSSDASFLEACSDKWNTYQIWKHSPNVVTPPTFRASEIDSQDSLERHLEERPYSTHGWTLKRTDGAGCDGQKWFPDARSLLECIRRLNTPEAWIAQPWALGEPGSVATLFGAKRIVLPPCRQQIVVEGDTVSYLGGEIAFDWYAPEQWNEWVDEWIAGFPGKPMGWIGFDFVVTAGSKSPLAIEINPRLTTSFIGYQRLIQNQLTQGIVDVCRGISWTPHFEKIQLQFEANGTIRDKPCNTTIYTTTAHESIARKEST